MNDFNPNPDPTLQASVYAKLRSLERADEKPGASDAKPARAARKPNKIKLEADAKWNGSSAFRATEEGFAGAAAGRARTHDEAPAVDATARAEAICGVVRLYRTGLVTAENMLLVVGNIVKPE